ncbi:MAG: hypothetical protein JXR86_14940 [Spirochaetales bacterium]|nr:hypothetical protein [Spirochaetales bacterium]
MKELTFYELKQVNGGRGQHEVGIEVEVDIKVARVTASYKFTGDNSAKKKKPNLMLREKQEELLFV